MTPFGDIRTHRRDHRALTQNQPCGQQPLGSFCRRNPRRMRRRQRRRQRRRRERRRRDERASERASILGASERASVDPGRPAGRFSVDSADIRAPDSSPVSKVSATAPSPAEALHHWSDAFFAARLAVYPNLVPGGVPNRVPKGSILRFWRVWKPKMLRPSSGNSWRFCWFGP